MKGELINMIGIYDIEISPNLVLIVIKDELTGQIWKFKQTKNKSNFDKFKEFVTQQDLTLVGFNNNRYDDKIVKFILDNNSAY